ncbi:hypothetical protein MesoLj131a_62420 [Mesorhizobium sp. 131-2-1]|nr:hypothetical protein MesoLj131a_62420 [Mesorhizobium sp. 131-2-1]BCH04449.1 hypothetical protein MesoLj131b_64480 [Mesorhizobium sp. 131-2-5]
MNVEYLATQMGQAGSFSNGAALVELIVAAESVGLEGASKSGELAHHALAGAAHGGAIPGDRRLLRTRVAVVGDVDPERALVRLASAGRQDRKPRVVGVNLAAGTADLTDAVVDRIEQGGGVAGATRKRGSLDIDALGGHHLYLTVVGQIITPLGHHDMGKCGIAELAACNGLGWCRRLDDFIAGPAAVLGSNGLHHLPGLGDQIEHLVAIFAHGAQIAAAARAACARRLANNALARQVGVELAHRQHPDLVGVSDDGRLDIGHAGSYIGLEIFELEQHLAQLLGRAAEGFAVEAIDLQLQALDAKRGLGALSSQLLIAFGDGGVTGRNGRLQKRDPGEEISG